MESRIQAGWMDTGLNDMIGTPYKIGDRFVRAYTSGRSCNLEVCTVTRIENDRMYANGSKVNIKFPGRCLIVNEQFSVQEMKED